MLTFYVQTPDRLYTLSDYRELLKRAKLEQEGYTYPLRPLTLSTIATMDDIHRQRHVHKNLETALSIISEIMLSTNELEKQILAQHWNGRFKRTQIQWYDYEK